MAVQKTCIAIGLLLLSAPANAVDRFEELYCLAKNIYFESRNQPKLGRIAVGQVTMNRVNSPRFPNSVCEVVQQGGERRNRCQFSWYCDGKIDEPEANDSWDDSVYLSLLIYSEEFTVDVTEGALWYHATYVSPSWAEHYEKTVQINEHIFYR
tara:strand:- start:507 stop:965 length:459 start_codon:yes stop_codon:yes gene_type:complete